MVGGETLTGGAISGTTAVGDETEVAEASVFRAVTATRMRAPTSVGWTT